MRVALIVPPLRAFDNARIPLGLITLAGSLRVARPEDEIFIIDECVPASIQLNEANLAQVVRTITKKALSWKPDLVGLTSTTGDFHHVIHLARELKRGDRNIINIVGGPHATIRPGEFFEHSGDIDFVLAGEGERLFPQFLDYLEHRAPIPERGVWRREGEKITGSRAELIKDLDSLPFPAYDLIDMERYTTPCVNNMRPLLLSSISLFTSRGCPYGCVFCATESIWGRGVRFFGPSRVVAEIEMLKNKYAIEAFFFFDETFAINRKHLKSICEELIKRDIGLPWGCQTRVDLVSEEVFETMKKAGCIQVEFGVEAGNEKGWRSLNKNITEEQVVQAFRLAHRKSLRTLVNYMINKPGETEQDLRDIASLIKRTKPSIGLTNIMTPYPETPIAETRGGIPVEDYHYLSMIDYPKFINFLESKWRFAEHTRPLLEVAREMNAVLRFSYSSLSLGFTDWFYGWKHILLILKSKRRFSYISLFLRLVRFRIRRVAVEGFRFLKDRIKNRILKKSELGTPTLR